MDSLQIFKFRVWGFNFEVMNWGWQLKQRLLILVTKNCRYPHRVSKRKAVVQFMFHNPEDVRWFKVKALNPSSQ